MKKIIEIPGGRGSNAKPSGTENPVGWGVKLEKTLRGGGMDIFWNHTFNMCGYKNIIVLTASSAHWIKRNILFHRPQQKGCNNNISENLYQAMQNIINIKILMYRLLYLTNGHTRWV